MRQFEAWKYGSGINVASSYGTPYFDLSFSVPTQAVLATTVGHCEHDLCR